MRLPAIDLGHFHVGSVRAELRDAGEGFVSLHVRLLAYDAEPRLGGALVWNEVESVSMLRPADDEELRSLVRRHVHEAVAREVDKWLRVDDEPVDGEPAR
jgi:hypothetical protein